MRHSLRTVFAVGLLALSAAFLPSGPASASGARDLTCQYDGQIRFTPGLTIFPQNVAITGSTTLGNTAPLHLSCISLTDTVGYHGGQVTFANSIGSQLGCINAVGLFGNAHGELKFQWDNGETSTVAWTVSAGVIGPLVITGTASGGQVAGTDAVITPVPTSVEGLCLPSAPLTTLGATGTITFIGL
ncbi:hypothetical protein ACIQWR_40860 [Streptomyces sp. NPDC098789]|uniref:hypothetical protein n=1 Tax=Streptomyces sp. NPDC098789 TaxID=3366098 RepID=UPI00382FA797